MNYFDAKPERERESEALLRELLDESKETYRIPPAAFESYKVKRGLREPDGTGVTAGVTKIGNAHGYVLRGNACP